MFKVLQQNLWFQPGQANPLSNHFSLCLKSFHRPGTIPNRQFKGWESLAAWMPATPHQMAPALDNNPDHGQFSIIDMEIVIWALAIYTV